MSMGARSVIRLPPMPTVNDLLKLYKIHAEKKLSQNFLLDRNLCKRIVKTSGNLKNCHVCEIGPGPGSITRAILEEDIAKLSVIEKDHKFRPNLEMLEDAVKGKMCIEWGDILNYDFEKMFDKTLKKDWNEHSPDIRVIGNLPFNISTPLIIKLLKQMSEKSGLFSYGRTKLTLTFQSEVAERLFAPPGHHQRCKLSVMAQYLSDVKYNFIISVQSYLSDLISVRNTVNKTCVSYETRLNVPDYAQKHVGARAFSGVAPRLWNVLPVSIREAFKPPPKVCVGVVSFTPLKFPLINQPFDLVSKIVKTIFTHRQKKCIKTLRLLVPEDIAVTILRKADVDSCKRPYQLSTKEFSRICDAYHEMSLLIQNK
ncbi:Dimethyladenosine transferase 1, mitochondrial [Nymphon striatum]|nr:Dimethyladenosine transferase 1, mitochondrial [Nymphon striatum]